MPDRIGPSVVFQRRVVGKDRIPRESGRDQVGVNRIGTGIGARRDNAIYAAPNPNQAPGATVVGQEGFLCSGSHLATGGQVSGKFLPGEDRVPPKERPVLCDRHYLTLVRILQVNVWVLWSNIQYESWKVVNNACYP